MSRFSFSNLNLSEVMDVVRSIMENAPMEEQLFKEIIEDRRDPPRELGTERNSWLKLLTLWRQRRAFETVVGSRKVFY